MIVLNVLLIVAAILVAIPAAMFSVEVLLAVLFGRKTPVINDTSKVPSFAVLIPAHNEQTVIAKTLATLLPTIPAQGRVIVVADNCSDATAAIARECGAIAVERFDTTRRGKGWALDFGIESLSVAPPEVVVFLDADCCVDEHTATRLAVAAQSSGCPVQGLNLCDPDPNGGALQAVSGLAFRFKNLVRPLGLTKLAGMTHLTGTGMALPWARINRAQVASSNVVEDMQLGIDLAVAGFRTKFLPTARVNSPLPQQRAAAKTQRTRWEHGHLRTLMTQVPRLFARACATRRCDLFLLALDLAIPPLSLLVMMTVAFTLLATVAALFGGSPIAAAIAGTALLSIVSSVVLGWAVFCRQQIPLRALVLAPLYALWKVPLYVAFLWRRQQQWVRTARDSAA
ncbi:N-glycosyltransferase [Anatilimnocola aggregata]|uniref:N-glycosyltransferase n=1 Tax=Anatilimnocola aggregata TaxID=2528021 RepID=A0A517YAT5_9BACT|nr:glycosyltransferase family 2 protein [Anatilimnocola aggregata]QDU27343.1 N-glycosyltransferase [Anatilimnocola aggregata]